jgi:hypothetical protein
MKIMIESKKLLSIILFCIFKTNEHIILVSIINEFSQDFYKIVFDKIKKSLYNKDRK